jgi:hypothetical protein
MTTLACRALVAMVAMGAQVMPVRAVSLAMQLPYWTRAGWFKEARAKREPMVSTAPAEVVARQVEVMRSLPLLEVRAALCLEQLVAAAVAQAAEHLGQLAAAAAALRSVL